jgi:hypothetical protein
VSDRGIVKTNTDQSMISLVDKALMSPDVDVGKMQIMLDMQERIYDKNAQIEFNKAMSLCQQEMPAIAKTSENLQTNSKYAKYETIVIDTKPTYTKHGFSISFAESKSDKADHIRVEAELMHSQGHSKSFYADLPLDIAGIKGNANKTAVHATGSTFSYAKRYLFCMIFNVALANADDDAVKAGAITIQDLLEYNANVRELFDYISEIKEGLANLDCHQAALAWMDMTSEQRDSIWKAPSKGGILTTAEIAAIKGNEFSSACKAIVAQPKIEE